MVSAFSRLDARLRRLPDWLLLAVGLTVIIGIAALSIYVQHDVPVVDFFLVPVAATGWLTSRARYGYAAALFAAVMSVVMAVAGEATAPMGPALTAGAARFVLYVVVLSVLGIMRNMHLEHERDATTDDQTGAVNARAFRALAGVELDRGRRYDHEISLLYVDVDDFKAVNDKFGHGEGDKVLRGVSHVLRCSVRSTDIVARVGGDEFVVLMPETDRRTAALTTRRLRDELVRVTTPDGLPVRFSMGLATLVTIPESVDEMLRAADELMYRAKRRGKDRVEAAELIGTAFVA